jgi:geranylgeranyl diphosphate synthase type I
LAIKGFDFSPDFIYTKFMTKLVLVDKKDRVVGYASKEKCHQGKGLLHRAFSVYIFNRQGELLIQQRSRLKPLWPLYWANSCCSHPRRGEGYKEAGERRLEEELGFTCSLKLVDKFQYQALYKNKGSENEVCAILSGKYDGKVRPNRREAAGWKWVDAEKIKNDFKRHRDKYTPWFKIGLERCLKIRSKERERKKRLAAFLEKTAEKINLTAEYLLKKHIDGKFGRIVHYQISTGGKRLRPALAIAAAKLFGGKLNDVLCPAAGLEILHNCTLITDDIIDHSRVRRNKPTVWSKFGKSIAECLSLDYLASAFEGASEAKNSSQGVKIFARTLKTIMDGEIYDILFEQKGRDDEPYIAANRRLGVGKKDYYKMAGKKTAFLFQSACEVGGICGKANKKDLERIKNFGFNLGMAFQIQDDILDTFGDEKKFGKKIGKDIEERKLGNIVILFALERMANSEKEKIMRVFQRQKITNKDIQSVVNLIKNTDALYRAEDLAESFLNKARAELKFLPQNKWNKILESFVEFIAQRDN